MVSNPMNIQWRNNLLWIILRVEVPTLKQRLLECVIITDQEPMNSPRWNEALKELEAFGRKHLI